MKLAGPALALFFVSFFVTSFVLAGITINPDITAHTFSLSCDSEAPPLQVSIPAGGYALIATSTSVSCTYLLPLVTNPAHRFRFVALYKGVVGSSTPISGDSDIITFAPGHFAASSATSLTTSPNNFADAQSGEDYFAVTFDTEDPENMIGIPEYVRDSSAGGAVSPTTKIDSGAISNYQIFAFKWGAGPTDSTGPVITITPPTQTLEATSSIGAVAEFTVTATDDTDGDVAASCDKVTGSMFSLGTTTITCTSTDIAGNTTASTSEVVIRDTTPPIITLIGSSTISLTVGDTFIDEGATTSDAVDNSVSIVVGGDTVDMATAGTYTITYNATDASGNQGVEVTRSVEVVAPVPVVVIPPTPDPAPTPTPSSGGGGGGGGIVSGPLSIGYQTPTPVIPAPVVAAITTFVAPVAETVVEATPVTSKPKVAGVQTEIVTAPTESTEPVVSTPTPEPVTPPATTQTAAVATATSDYSLPLWAWALLPILGAITALFFVLRRGPNPAPRP